MRIAAEIPRAGCAGPSFSAAAVAAAAAVPPGRARNAAGRARGIRPGLPRAGGAPPEAGRPAGR